MDRAPIKPEIPGSLMADYIIHNGAGTDLTISALYYSGTKGGDATELKLESPLASSVKTEEKIGDEYIDKSPEMKSGLVIIAPQEDNYHRYELTQKNGIPNTPDHEEAIKQDISIPIDKQEKTGDVSMEEIHNSQIIKEEIPDSKEYIKLEDDINFSCVDNINEKVETEGQSVVMKNELSGEELKEDFAESESFDADSGQSDDQVSRRTGKPRNHQRTHAGEKPHACTTCDKTFKTRTHLKVHQRTHTGEKPYVCTLCDKSFSDSSHLKVHQRTHTGEKPYVCTLCDKGFSTLGNLKVHLKTHTTEKPYVCTVCDKCFKNQSSLIYHQRTHTGEKPYRCTMCDKTFRSQSQLKVHQRNHTGETPYGCTICEKCFKTSSALQRHQRTHTGEKPYACTLCDKSFSDQSQLKIHQRNHTGEKPYLCTICEKHFKTSSALQRHQRTHTGEKP